MTSSLTRRYLDARARSLSPNYYSKAMNRSSEYDRIVTQMCRPPPGWPSSGGVPPLSRNDTFRSSLSRSYTYDPPTERTWPTSDIMHHGMETTSNRTCEQPKVVKDAITQYTKGVETEVDKMHDYMDHFVDRMDQLWVDSFDHGSNKPANARGCSSNNSGGRGASVSATCKNNLGSNCQQQKVADETTPAPEPVQIVDENGQKRLVYSLDLTGFKPEEIKVNLNTDDGVVTIEACHEEREKAKYFKRFYSRKFTVPEDMRVSIAKHTFRSFLSERGTLSIEAPLPDQGQGAPSSGRHQPSAGSCTNNNNNSRNNNGSSSLYRQRCLPDYYDDVVNAGAGANRSSSPGRSHSPSRSCNPRCNAATQQHCKTCRCSSERN